MNIAIVDDAEGDRRKLQTLLQNWADQQELCIECDTYKNAESLLEAYVPGKYPILFLDIYMDKTDGIETARRIRRKDISCMIIFLTSSMDHQSEAFAVHAFEYLEKPVTEERLFAVMNDAKALLVPHAPYLTLFSGKNSFPLFYSDIRSVSSDMQYCVIQTNETGRFRVSFREIEAELSADPRFLLINRGILVNMDYVASMEGAICQMKDGTSYPINTRKQTILRQAYIDYQFDARERRMHGQQSTI